MPRSGTVHARRKRRAKSGRKGKTRKKRAYNRRQPMSANAGISGLTSASGKTVAELIGELSQVTSQLGNLVNVGAMSSARTSSYLSSRAQVAA